MHPAYFSTRPIIPSSPSLFTRRSLLSPQLVPSFFSPHIMFESANGSLRGSLHYFRISFSFSFSSIYRVLQRCIHESFQQLPEDSALLVAPCTRLTTHPRWHFFPLPRMFLSSNTLLQQDNFSSLKCRSTLLEYIRVQNPAAGLSPHYYFDLTSSETRE